MNKFLNLLGLNIWRKRNNQYIHQLKMQILLNIGKSQQSGNDDIFEHVIDDE